MNISTNTYIIFGTIILILIGLSLIGFVVYYQRKQLLNEIKLQVERRQLENDMQRNLLQNAIEVQENERRRLAKDLHDEVGAILSALKMANNQLFKLESTNSAIQNIATNNRELIDESITLVRNISKDLVPQTLENFGMVHAIEEFFHKLEKHTGIKFDFKYENFNDDKRFLSSIELSLFRIIQELSNNAIKHSLATIIKLYVGLHDNKLYFSFTDNGIGFDLEQKLNDKNNGLGLRNIESRLSVIDTEYKVTTETNKGTKFEIWINEIQNHEKN
jgi:signal transduction histidine kinase